MSDAVEHSCRIVAGGVYFSLLDFESRTAAELNRDVFQCPEAVATNLGLGRATTHDGEVSCVAD